MLIHTIFQHDSTVIQAVNYLDGSLSQVQCSFKMILIFLLILHFKFVFDVAT